MSSTNDSRASTQNQEPYERDIIVLSERTKTALADLSNSDFCFSDYLENNDPSTYDTRLQTLLVDSNEKFNALYLPDSSLPDYINPSDDVHSPTQVARHLSRSKHVPHRLGDAHVTRSDLLDFTAEEFEHQFAPVWAYYRQHSSEILSRNRSRLDGDIVALVEDNSVSTARHAEEYYYDYAHHPFASGPDKYSGMIVPDAPDNGLDLIEWFSSPCENPENPDSGLRPYDHTKSFRFLQLKQYDDTKVSAPDVQAFIGACLEHQSLLSDEPNSFLDEAYLVTTNQFTTPAKHAITRFNDHQHVEFDIVPVEADTVVRLFRRHYPNQTLDLTRSEITERFLTTSSHPFPLTYDPINKERCLDDPYP